MKFGYSFNRTMWNIGSHTKGMYLLDFEDRRYGDKVYFEKVSFWDED